MAVLTFNEGLQTLNIIATLGRHSKYVLILDEVGFGG